MAGSKWGCAGLLRAASRLSAVRVKLQCCGPHLTLLSWVLCGRPNPPSASPLSLAAVSPREQWSGSRMHSRLGLISLPLRES